MTIPAGIAAEPAQKPSRPPANPRVLIIEPHALQRAVLVRRLSQWHYAPEAVDSGEAALQMLGVSQRKRKAVPDRFLSAFGGGADREQNSAGPASWFALLIVDSSISPDILRGLREVQPAVILLARPESQLASVRTISRALVLSLDDRHRSRDKD